jgi:hypothetical protein
MGQEPRIEVAPDLLPRDEAGPAPARRWTASRPGDLHAPSEVPWGGAFGTPGPDTGYALKLASAASYDLDPGESRHNVEAALVLVMGARASLSGKAPSIEDLNFALLLLGLDPRQEIPDAVAVRLAAARKHWAPRVAHSKGESRGFVTLLSSQLLRLSPGDLRHRLALGEVPLAV